MSSPIIALIPARSGSLRVKNKNIKELKGHPLMAYTVTSACESGIFDRVLVSTDCPEIATIARHYGAEVPFLRSKNYAHQNSPDIEWVSELLNHPSCNSGHHLYYSILRPTSPFRKIETIKRAWKLFNTSRQGDTLRAVELCDQHPYKMWTTNEDQTISPLIKSHHQSLDKEHNLPYQNLPKVYIQNASLEIATIKTTLENFSITGNSIIPFFTNEEEGFDINTMSDWNLALTNIQNGLFQLAPILKKSFQNHGSSSFSLRIE